MDAEFWHDKWRNNQIGFHEGRANGLLTGHFGKLTLAPDAHVFLPLCGKAHDLDWLLAQGCRVTGIELNRPAIEEAVTRLGLDPQIRQVGDLTVFCAGEVTFFAGDFFNLTADMLGPVDAVYDRAALVALPEGMRRDYAAHLMALTGSAPQLLIALDYDQSQTDGPPFAVDEAEVRRHYDEHYDLTRVASVPIDGPLAKRCSGDEVAWLLETR